MHKDIARLDIFVMNASFAQKGQSSTQRGSLQTFVAREDL
jgi:hypothetical protein